MARDYGRSTAAYMADRGRPDRGKCAAIWNRLAGWLRILIVVALLLPAAPPSPAYAEDAQIGPPGVPAELAPGQSQQFEVSIPTGIPPIPRLDVLFLFDVTNS